MYYKINSDLTEVICEYDRESVLIDILPDEVRLLDVVGCLYLSTGELIFTEAFNFKTFKGGIGLDCMRTYKRDRKINEVLNEHA